MSSSDHTQSASAVELSPSVIRRIDGAAEALREDLIRDIARVVAIPSVVGREHEMQVAMEALYRDEGLSVTRLAPDAAVLRDHPMAIETGLSFEGRHNLVAEMRGSAAAPSLILNGHMDVVDPGDLEKWSVDPWSGAVHGDWLYGRGAGDMKAGLIANLYAVKALTRAGYRPRGHVMLQAVIDEEAGGTAGTLACLLAGQRADAIVCTEPHSLNVTIAHAGVAYFRVHVEGRAAHAGQANRGINAIVKMMSVVAALEQLGGRRALEMRHPLIDVGGGQSCHLNIGTMRGGEWPSSVPGSAVIECRIGFVPGETLAGVRRQVEGAIAQAVAGDPWLDQHPPRVEWFGWQAEPWQQEPEHAFVKQMRSAVTLMTGRAPELLGRAAGLDTRFAGAFGIPAVCFGPVVENMHGVDERVNIPSVVATVKALAGLIAGWCGLVEEEKAA